LTNVALALGKAPEIVPNVSRCVVMGGAANVVGNITPAAEYNIWCDPEAARMVFRSGLPVEMVGWELCRGDANLSDEDMRYCKEVINTPLSHFAIDCNASALDANRNWLSDPGLGLPDPVAMAMAIDEHLHEKKRDHYGSRATGHIRGMMVDQLVTPHDSATSRCGNQRPAGRPHITVCWKSTRNAGRNCYTDYAVGPERSD
jgi:inosine-uridine nucleoside N-ribohydrolase